MKLETMWCAFCIWHNVCIVRLFSLAVPIYLMHCPWPTLKSLFLSFLMIFCNNMFFLSSHKHNSILTSFLSLIFLLSKLTDLKFYYESSLSCPITVNYIVAVMTCKTRKKANNDNKKNVLRNAMCLLEPKASEVLGV